MITQELLKQVLHYNQDTGLFTRLSTKKIAGTLRPDGYVQITINKKIYKAHRLAFIYVTGSLPTGQIDHINMVRNDNKWSNLRDVSRSQNNMNRNAHSNNKTGIKGVYWDKSRNRWCAQAVLNRKHIHLGYHLDIELAKKAYVDFATKYHGEFLRV